MIDLTHERAAELRRWNLGLTVLHAAQAVLILVLASDFAIAITTAPPDMSLMARAKGADYIYSFLKGFFLDPDNPTGVDNLYLPGTSMPQFYTSMEAGRGFWGPLNNDPQAEIDLGKGVTKLG